MLKPHTPIFKSADPDFNHKAATAAYELVMKMDADEAREFTSHVVNDVLEETIEKNLRTLQQHLDRVVAKRTEKIKKAAIRATISKSEGSVEFAKALSVITKADAGKGDIRGAELTDFNRAHPRDSSGRFRTTVRTVKAPPMRDKQALALGIQPHPKDSTKQKLKAEDRSRYQQEYAQIRDFLNSVQESTGGDADVLLHVQDKAGRRSVVRNNGTRVDPTAWDPSQEKVVGVDAKPNNLTAGGAAFSLTSALGGGANTSMVQGVNAADQNFGSFANDWTRNDFDPRNPNDRMYNRLTAGSQFLSQVAPTGSKAQVAAEFGRFVGSHGPQAEAVIGPSARKTAYRYRGTERTPDKAMADEYGRAIQRAKMENASVSSTSPMQMAAQRVMAERRNPEWDEREAGRQVVLSHLRTKMPSGQLYDLQLKSGNTPPSEGVMLNADGQIAAQASGYGDDHYLPFNLKNLKSLKGGEYIRTRSVGGVTSEDIYTGLMAGARQVTVTSRSGTFTVEFEPDFRGGRRHNDKAKRMVRRYEQLLDAIQSRQVNARPVPMNIQNEIRHTVEAEFPGEPPSVIRQMTAKKVKEFKENPDLTPQDDAIIARLTAAGLAQDETRDAKAYRRAVTNQILRDKKFVFQLDGEGYAAAMDALAEQFPYYITTRHQIVDEQDVVNLGTDRGYVEPGRNRPTEARAGLYGTETNAGQKISASQADYQGARATQRGGTPDGAEKPEEKKAEEGKKTNVIDSAIKQRRHSEAAVNAFRAVKGLKAENRQGMPIMEKTEEEFAAWVLDPGNAKKFEDEVIARLEQVNASGGLDESLRTVLNNYKRAAGDVETREFEPSMGLKWSASPYKFAEHPYTSKATPEQRGEEVRKINRRSQSLRHGGNLSSLTEDQMKDEVNALANAYRVINDNPEIKGQNAEGAQLRKELRERLLPEFDQAGLSAVMQRDKGLEKHLEDVHRMRALIGAGAWTPSEAQNVTARVIPAGTTSTMTTQMNVIGGANAVEARMKEIMQRRATSHGILAPEGEYRAVNDGHALIDAIKDGSASPEEIQVYLDETQKYLS